MKILKTMYPKWNCNHDRKVFVVSFGGEEYVLYLPLSIKMYLGEVAEPEVSEETIKKCLISYLVGKYFYHPFSCIRHIILDEDRERGKNPIVKMLLSPVTCSGDRSKTIREMYSSRPPEESEEVISLLNH